MMTNQFIVGVCFTLALIFSCAALYLNYRRQERIVKKWKEELGNEIERTILEHSINPN